VDEISWRKHHKYFTLVVDHDRGKVIWGAKGRDSKTLDEFFDELGEDRSACIEAVSMDLGPAYLKSVTAEAMLPRPSCAPIRSIWSSSSVTPSTRSVRSWGTTCASSPTIVGPSVKGVALGIA
jgi:hypothetical protein